MQRNFLQERSNQIGIGSRGRTIGSQCRVITEEKQVILNMLGEEEKEGEEEFDINSLTNEQILTIGHDILPSLQPNRLDDEENLNLFLFGTEFYVSAFDGENETIDMSLHPWNHPVPLGTRDEEGFRRKIHNEFNWREDGSPLRVFQISGTEMEDEIPLKRPEEAGGGDIKPDDQIVKNWVREPESQSRINALSSRVNNSFKWGEKVSNGLNIVNSVVKILKQPKVETLGPFAKTLAGFGLGLSSITTITTAAYPFIGTTMKFIADLIFSKVRKKRTIRKLEKLKAEVRIFKIVQEETNFMIYENIKKPTKKGDFPKYIEVIKFIDATIIQPGERFVKVIEKNVTILVRLGVELVQMVEDPSLDIRKIFKVSKSKELTERYRNNIQTSFLEIEDIITQINGYFAKEIKNIYFLKLKFEKHTVGKDSKVKEAIRKRIVQLQTQRMIFESGINELLCGGTGLYINVKRSLKRFIDGIRLIFMASLSGGKYGVEHVAVEHLMETLFLMVQSIITPSKTKITEGLYQLPFILLKKTDSNVTLFKKAFELIKELELYEGKFEIPKWDVEIIAVVEFVNETWLTLHNFVESIPTKCRYNPEYGLFFGPAVTLHMTMSFFYKPKKFNFNSLKKDVIRFEAIEEKMSSIRARFTELTFNLQIPFSIFFNGLLYTLKEKLESGILKDYVAKYRVIEIFPEQKTKLFGFDKFERLISRCSDDLFEGSPIRLQFENRLRFMVGVILLRNKNSRLFLIALSYFIFNQTIKDDWGVSSLSYYRFLKEQYKQGERAELIEEKKIAMMSESVKRVMMAFVEDLLFEIGVGPGVFKDARNNSFVRLLYHLHKYINK